MRARACFSWALGLAATGAGLLFACAPQEVVLAELPERPDGGGGIGKPCVGDDDCEAASFCARNNCSDATGRCEERPAFCDGAIGISCGCDGITYWNDCLRRLAGVTAHTEGPCGPTAAICNRDKACPGTSLCGRLAPPRGRCDAPDMPGHCWALPATCTGTLAVFETCGPGPVQCRDACAAIRTQAPHRSLDRTTCP